MNYIAQINAFWDSATTNPLSTGQVSLYFALLHVCNRSNWTEWFAAPNQVLSVLTGLSRSGILKARNELKQRGLIDFQEKATKATRYKITIANSTQVSTQIGVQNSTQDGVQVGMQISDTLYKHKQKQNIKNTATAVQEMPELFEEQIAAIREFYDSVCGSYPRPVKLSEARKEEIRARLRDGYTVEDFRKLFELAEASDFLKGNNNRSWSATFDWLIADANMAKVLAGNYANRTVSEKNTKKSASRFSNFQERQYDYESMLFQERREKVKEQEDGREGENRGAGRDQDSGEKILPGCEP